MGSSRKSYRRRKPSRTSRKPSQTSPAKPSTIKPTVKPIIVKSKPELELRGIFRKMGIYGWDDIEVPILASAAAGLPVLLVGNHGSSKTESIYKITSLFFEEPEFRAYEAMNVSIDDLIGYPNPASLTKGKLDYLHTPLSIWGANSVLFDEINRANPFTQSKLHEVIRTRKINGIDTGVSIVFSSVNPAKRYSVTVLDMALASRFMIFDVPSLSDLASDDIDNIISTDVRNFELPSGYPKAFREVKKLMKNVVVPIPVSSIVKEVVKNVPSYSGRQAVRLSLALRALFSFEKVFDYKVENNEIVTLLVGTIPECHGIVAESIDKNKIVAIVRDILMMEDYKELARKLANSEYNNEVSLILDDLVSNPTALDYIVQASVGKNDSICKAAEARLRLSRIDKDKSVLEVMNKIVRVIFVKFRGGESPLAIAIENSGEARLITMEGEELTIPWYLSYVSNVKTIREVLRINDRYDVEIVDVSQVKFGKLLAEKILSGKVIDILFS